MIDDCRGRAGVLGRHQLEIDMAAVGQVPGHADKIMQAKKPGSVAVDAARLCFSSKHTDEYQ